jgi:hypothetical protein
VLDQDLKLVNIAELEHTKKNIDMLAGRHEIILGKIINKDESRDCITIVTYKLRSRIPYLD